jgi:hypothetical protein
MNLGKPKSEPVFHAVPGNFERDGVRTINILMDIDGTRLRVNAELTFEEVKGIFPDMEMG